MWNVFAGAKLVESFNHLKTIGSILDLKPQDKTKFRVMFVCFQFLSKCAYYQSCALFFNKDWIYCGTFKSTWYFENQHNVPEVSLE